MCLGFLVFACQSFDVLSLANFKRPGWNYEFHAHWHLSNYIIPSS